MTMLRSGWLAEFIAHTYCAPERFAEVSEKVGNIYLALMLCRIIDLGKIAHVPINSYCYVP
jgi:hypothetical protein